MPQAGYRRGRHKLLWGEHSKDGWYGAGARAGRKLRGKIDWERLQLKLISDNNKVDPEDEDWDLEDDKRTPEASEDFEKLSEEQPVMLFDVEKDPTETEDISEQFPEIVAAMKNKLLEASRTMRRGNFELKSTLGHPFFHGGNFMPGWCKAEQ